MQILHSAVQERFVQLSRCGLLGGGKRQCALQGMWMVKENITQYSMTTVKMKHEGPITVLGMQDCR